MNFICSLLAFMLFSTTGSYDYWGASGHRVTAAVASEYLTPEARSRIADLLDGQSMVLVSNYADEIRSDERYAEFSTWHYVNYPFDKTYADSGADKEPNLIRGLEFCMRKLSNSSVSRKDKQFYLKLLIHFMGDLHQPLHLGRAEDKGGNTIGLSWFGDRSNLHRVWDSGMIDTYGMSYSELAENLPVISREEIDAICKGSIREWAEEIRKLTQKVYAAQEKGDHLGYAYMYQNFDLVRWQLLKGGLRLSTVLNRIFDPEFPD